MDIQNIITNYINTNYQPVQVATATTIRETTNSLHSKLFAFYPFADFTPGLLASILYNNGFEVADDGEFNLEWLFEVRTHLCPLIEAPKE